MKTNEGRKEMEKWKENEKKDESELTMKKLKYNVNGVMKEGKLVRKGISGEEIKLIHAELWMAVIR